MNAIIKPINPGQEQQVLEHTEYWIARAGNVFNSNFDPVPVFFNLDGRIAGMYRIKNGQRQIRYNPRLFAKYFEDNLAVTVPHEVAHYIIDCVFGAGNVKPHGMEWKDLMQAFEVDCSRTCSYDFNGIPLKMEKRHGYQCGCKLHQLSARRHNRVLKKRAHYVCKSCGGKLQYREI